MRKTKRPAKSTAPAATPSSLGNSTRRKQVEEALRESEERYRALVELAPDAVIVYQEWRFVYANAAALQLYGADSFEQLRGKDIFPSMLPEDHEILRQRVRRVLAGERVPLRSTRVVRLDGAQVPVEAAGTRIEWGGQPAVQAVLRDITERMRTEAALRQTQQQLQDIIDGSPNIIFIKDRAGRFLVANRTLERIMGVPRGGWRGKTDYDLLPKERADYFCREDRRILEDCACRQVEEQVRMPDGQHHSFLANKFPLLDAQGHPYALCGISVDITERKRIEQQLRKVSEELARANHRLEQAVQDRTAELREAVQELHRFSYTLMHDMRAPLRAMHSFVSVIQQQCAGCEQAQVFEYLERIQTAAERMDTLIRDALDYAKAVQQHMRLSPVDLGHLLRGLLESYPNLQSPGAEIRVREPLPVVVGNEAALTQCFASLLGNAVKFVAVGTRPQVQVRAEPREGFWRVWVEDNGIGIAPEDQERIFEMFQRLDQRNYDGTGIGLTIVRKTVERMGGRLGIESAPGQGSRFWVELKRVAR